MVRRRVHVCVRIRTSVKHSCGPVGSWWDRGDWLSLPLPHPIMLICSGTNRRTPLGVLQAHSQSLVLQKIVLQSYLNRKLPSFSSSHLLPSLFFRHFILFNSPVLYTHWNPLLDFLCPPPTLYILFSIQYNNTIAQSRKKHSKREYLEVDWCI